MTTIVKATTKGQITLPAKWRRNFETNQYILDIKEDTLTVKPLELDDIESGDWEVIFDADRDNDGKSIPISDLIQALDKLE